MEFQVGETHSGYEFLDVLKRSKNGIEFRVKNTLAGRIEALRTMPEGARNDPQQSERFLREMRVHAGLVHPNIVTLFNAIELGNQLVITTELVEGPTVADKLSRGPLAWPDAVSIARQVLAGAGYAHQHGIVHRSIAPENIVIGKGGIVKLANFALAKGADSPRLTQVGVPIGNLKYISPEQIKAIGDVDSRSDLYSTGMVLYEMLCGRPAFVMESEFELMAAQVGSAPVSPHEVNPKVPEELGAVLLKALAKIPAERYQTAAEFDEALVRMTVSEMVRATPAAPKAAASAARNGVPAAAKAEEIPQHAASQPAPKPATPAFLAGSGGPVLSRQQMILIGAAGAGTAVLLAALWILIR
jgi:eukaryotic-like serine/threonine-protein kinase